jgi:hypothetical protein
MFSSLQGRKEIVWHVRMEHEWNTEELNNGSFVFTWNIYGSVAEFIDPVRELKPALKLGYRGVKGRSDSYSL